MEIIGKSVFQEPISCTCVYPSNPHNYSSGSKTATKCTLIDCHDQCSVSPSNHLRYSLVPVVWQIAYNLVVPRYFNVLTRKIIMQNQVNEMNHIIDDRCRSVNQITAGAAQYAHRQACNTHAFGCAHLNTMQIVHGLATLIDHEHSPRTN